MSKSILTFARKLKALDLLLKLREFSSSVISKREERKADRDFSIKSEEAKHPDLLSIPNILMKFTAQ